MRNDPRLKKRYSNIIASFDEQRNRVREAIEKYREHGKASHYEKFNDMWAEAEKLRHELVESLHAEEVPAHESKALARVDRLEDLYKTIIIICDFYPSNNILETNSGLDKLKSYISLKGKSEFCKTYRINQIAGRTSQFIDETKRNYVIILPNLTNTIINNEFATSYGYGCNAICMKYQNYDENLQAYIKKFLNSGNYSWNLKPSHLITNVLAGFAVVPFTTHRPLTDVTGEIQRILSTPR